MVIRLKQEWLGHPIGAIVKVNDDYANSLFQRDVAEKMEPESNVAIKEKLQYMVSNKVRTSKE
jgi:hypothetical protein